MTQEPDFINCKDDNGYPWVRIKYKGHEGFACDWGDCLEELIFIYGYVHSEPYLEYDDPDLEIKYLYIRNEPIYSAKINGRLAL